jgi:hypothetical protein
MLELPPRSFYAPRLFRGSRYRGRHVTKDQNLKREPLVL